VLREYFRALYCVSMDAYSSQGSCTLYLRLQPLESCATELLVRRSVCEAVCDCYIWEELKYATLHSQFVKVGVQKGRDALRHIRYCRRHGVVEGIYTSKRWLIHVIVCGATAIAEGGVGGRGGASKVRGALYQMRNQRWLMKGSNESFVRRLVGAKVKAVTSNFTPNSLLSESTCSSDGMATVRSWTSAGQPYDMRRHGCARLFGGARSSPSATFTFRVHHSFLSTRILEKCSLRYLFWPYRCRY
jgi:hypothetical protein